MESVKKLPDALAKMQITLNCLRMREWKQMPMCAAIYFRLSYLEEGILYVGKTKSLRARIMQHTRKAVYPSCDRIAWIRVNESLLDEIEQSLILWLRPWFNIAHNSEVRKSLRRVRQ